MEKENQQLNMDVAETTDVTDEAEQTAQTADASQMEVAKSDSGDNPSTVSAQTRKKISKTIDVLLWVLVAVLAISVIVRAFFYTDITISGESMYPTYNDKQVVGVSKVGSPSRGDVVVFYTKDIESKFLALFATRAQSETGGKYEKYIKRIVALPGDKLWVEQVENDIYQVVIQATDGTIYREDYYEIDGGKLPAERYLVDTNHLGCLKNHTQDNPLTVSEGCFFAMGDNRVDSYDSRSFGEVPLDRLYGVVL